MAKIEIGTKYIGKIRPVNGVGQPPFIGMDFSYVKMLKDAGIPYSRLHDVGGAYGRNEFADVPNLFRDFDADPYDPANYDFASTDILIKSLIDNDVEPFFRLGVTIENGVESATKGPQRIFAPKDPHKWAVICEHIVRHYNEGWANGFHYNIQYWEIWNEPENAPNPNPRNPCWIGTDEQFMELYDAASKHLKKCFPDIKIGGYGSCGFYEARREAVGLPPKSAGQQNWVVFANKFLAFCKENNCPLDFFSWHCYDDAYNFGFYPAYVRKKLDSYGFVKTEQTCNEWNPGAAACSWHPDPALKGTAKNAGDIAYALLAFQNSCLDSAMFYDARIGKSFYGGLFDSNDGTPLRAYYAFTSFNELRKLENQIESSSDDARVLTVAAEKDGKKAIMIANPGDEDVELDLSFDLIGYKVTSDDFTDKYFEGNIKTITKNSFAICVVK